MGKDRWSYNSYMKINILVIFLNCQFLIPYQRYYSVLNHHGHKRDKIPVKKGIERRIIVPNSSPLIILAYAEVLYHQFQCTENGTHLLTKLIYVQ